MSKKSSSGGGMLLVAGLGIGAFMLFANKSNAKGNTPSGDLPTGNDIPDAPKILAVNSSDSESPLPTGIVSDEEGMETTSSGSAIPSASGSSDSSGEDNSDDSPYGPLVNTVVSAGMSVFGRRKSEGDNIPPLISTKLTEKEKAIIDKGVLSDDLAVKRPDLYKAIYIRKHGRNGNGQKALQAADVAIQSIQMKGNSTATALRKKKRKVAIALNPNSGVIAQAAASTGGGSAAMAALSTLSAMQSAGGNASATRGKKKPVHHKGARKKALHHTTAHHPAAKPPATKHPAAKHGTTTRHKAAPHKKHK